MSAAIAQVTVKPLNPSEVYLIDDLLELVTNEGAQALRLHVGAPPVLVVKGEDHAIEGPAISWQNAERFLRSMADTRLTRRIRRLGQAHFIYTFRGCHRFDVHAKVENDNVALELQDRA